MLVLENTRRYEIERVLWDATADDLPALAPKLAKLANEFATKIATVYVNEALSAGSLDSSSTVVPAGMDRVALGKYVAGEFDGPMQRCLQAQLVVFSGLKIDKLDDLAAMIDRGTIRWVITAGSLAMALKKAAAELDGKQFALGVAEDPAHSDKPYYIPRERIEQAKKMISEGRQKDIEFVLPVDFILQDGRASETIGPADQQFDVGPQDERTLRTESRRVHRDFSRKQRWLRSGGLSQRRVRHVRRSAIRSGHEAVHRATQADERCRRRGLRRRRRRGHGAGEIRPARLGHALLHRRRHGAERPGQQSGAVSVGLVDGRQTLISNRCKLVCCAAREIF